MAWPPVEDLQNSAEDPAPEKAQKALRTGPERLSFSYSGFELFFQFAKIEFLFHSALMFFDHSPIYFEHCHKLTTKIFVLKFVFHKNLPYCHKPHLTRS